MSYDGALALHIPSDIFIVRNPLLAGQQELATGAITSGGIRVLHEGIVRALNLSEEKTNQVAQRESQALRRREQAYKGNLAEPDMRDRLAIMIDPMFIWEVC